MIDAIIISINEFEYEIPDLTNINKTTFISIIDIYKLNNTYYAYWKTLDKSYLTGQNLWDILDESKTMPTDVIARERDRRSYNRKVTS